MKNLKQLALGLAAGIGFLGAAAPARAALPVPPAEIRAIAKEAYTYGFPIVDSYRILHAYTVDKSNLEYKAPPNQLSSIGRVFTPEDKAVQTPNSDTPYSMLAFDLRTEPLVLTVPAIEKDRYFSIQFVDAYTFNFAYVGSRTTGNGGGTILLVGPRWQGKTPAGISHVVRSETELGIAIYRTQLFNPGEIDKVRQIQAAYKAQPLSAFLGQRAPTAAPPIAYVDPLTPETQKTSLEFFNILNFVLQFCPTHPSEKELMSRFAKVGIGAGKRFDASTLGAAEKQAFQDGMADAWKELGEINKLVATGKLTSGDVFGTREHLQNNYAYRFAAAVLGIWGNSAAEAMYPAYRVDHQGQRLDGSNRYVLRFAADQLPPVSAFWSATMYELPASLLYANPLNRYLINSPMLPQMKRDADGGLTILVQNESPGKDRESNWLPSPKGPFWIALRLYWPKDEALSGQWKAPALQKQ
jgi:hypothetical protein